MKEKFHEKVEEMVAAKAVLRSGMPNSTAHERRAMRARHHALIDDISSLRHSRVFVSKKTGRK